MEKDGGGGRKRPPGQYRPMRPGDAHRGFLECLQYLSDVSQTTPERVITLFYERQSRGIITWVAELDKTIIGTASLIMEPKYAYGGRPCGHIEDVVVRPEYRKMGVGDELVYSLVSIATIAGCRKLILSCDEGVAPFYERQGFRPNGLSMRADL